MNDDKKVIVLPDSIQKLLPTISESKISYTNFPYDHAQTPENVWFTGGTRSLDLAKVLEALKGTGYVTNESPFQAGTLLPTANDRSTTNADGTETVADSLRLPSSDIPVLVWPAVKSDNQVTIVAGPKASFDPLKDAHVKSETVQGYDPKDVTDQLVVGGDKVDTTKPGTYTVTYTYNGADYSVFKTTKVTVVASKATVVGHDSSVDQNSDWKAADNFDSAKDADGNPFSLESVTVDGEVDTSKPGSYPVTYMYVDAAGNEMSKK